MRTSVSVKTAAAMLFVAVTWSPATAQNTSGPPLEREDQPRVYRTTGSRVAIGRSIQIPVDEEVSDAVVVIGGSLRIDGRVRDGVVVVGGNVQMGPQSDVRGDVVLVGGRLTRANGSQLSGSVSDVTFGEWGTWRIGNWYIPTVDFGDFGRWMSLLGTIFRVSLLGILMAFVLIIARAPVARVGRAAANEPAKAFVLGLIAEVLFVPTLVIASIGLIVTIIGIPLVAILVPVAFLAVFVAFILGFTGLACHVGQWIQDRLGWRANSAFFATAIGTLLILGPTIMARMVGVLPEPLRYTALALLLVGLTIEFIVWTIGFGAALLTGFGRWSTAVPPVPQTPVQSSIVTVTP